MVVAYSWHGKQQCHRHSAAVSRETVCPFREQPSCHFSPSTYSFCVKYNGRDGIFKIRTQSRHFHLHFVSPTTPIIIHWQFWACCWLPTSLVFAKKPCRFPADYAAGLCGSTSFKWQSKSMYVRKQLLFKSTNFFFIYLFVFFVPKNCFFSLAHFFGIGKST